MCMQRPDHDLIDTESRDNFGNRVSVGPISRIAAEMLFDDSYTGRFVPRIKGRGMSTGIHQEPRETQYFFTRPPTAPSPRKRP
ncbi:cell division FtsK/SpoIIIE domain protein [Mycobacterium xenopi 4042]|uniref:Cell division FtsK/SpoIIIE domain protein n=1 Tax=Mycobacterium xenopi 4042 TaxID=1299334 RepID=X8DA06_MYCXE|nr:cell division FtsK/SpoIIIE domain protein [Mycobacterium xenopi 4042]